MQSAAKSLFGLNRVYALKKLQALLIDVMLASIAVFLFLATITGVNSDLRPFIDPFSVFVAAVIIFYILRNIVRIVYVNFVIKKRNYGAPGLFRSLLFGSATSTELDKLDRKDCLQSAKDWSISDLTFDFYRETKNGRYLAKQAYYTAMELKLRRTLPHVLFDSKKAKGRQFKSIFLKAQRLTLEADFGRHFDAYIPQQYAVDALSFITPEVMETMMALDECDIEIIEDSVICFAPLLSKHELESFKNRCLELQRMINDNIENYRDDRLTGERRKTDTTQFSKRLLENPLRYLPGTIAAGAVLVACVVYAMQWEKIDELAIRFFIFASFLFVTGVWKMAKIKRENLRIIKQFEAGNH